MLVYRLELEDTQKERYGYFSAAIHADVNAKKHECLQTFSTLYMENCEGSLQPNPVMEGICTYMPLDYIVACTSIQQLYKEWFDEKLWLLQEAMYNFELVVYEVPNRYVAKGEKQVIFKRRKGTIVDVVQSSDLPNFIIS